MLVIPKGLNLVQKLAIICGYLSLSKSCGRTKAKFLYSCGTTINANPSLLNLIFPKFYILKLHILKTIRFFLIKKGLLCKCNNKRQIKGGEKRDKMRKTSLKSTHNNF